MRHMQLTQVVFFTIEWQNGKFTPIKSLHQETTIGVAKQQMRQMEASSCLLEFTYLTTMRENT